LEEIHTFSPTTVNEVRLGYSLIRHDELPQESVKDSSLGIQRSTANQSPGLPLILLARDQGGASIGTSDITYRGHTPSVSIGDVISLQRGKQSLRFGGEILHSQWRAHAAVFSYGEIDFPTFNDFLIGNTAASEFPGGSFGFAHLGTGLTDHDFITTDYHLFVQDDWKLSSKLTLNLGLRYELDLPPYDSQGRIGGFDPALEQPHMEGHYHGLVSGPAESGTRQAANALPHYSFAGLAH